MGYKLAKDTIAIYKYNANKLGRYEGLKEASWCFWDEVKLYIGEFFSPGYRQRRIKSDDETERRLRTLFSLDRTDYRGQMARSEIASVLQEAAARRREKIKKYLESILTKDGEEKNGTNSY
ncbi:MAG TPA: hypothetical protein VI968_03045 [archaeon]|nr:hypothetical protein [archaeon]